MMVTGNVDVSTRPFVRLTDRRQATIETAALVYDEAGGVAAALDTERTAMDVADADYAQLLEAGIPYQRAVRLGPGRYQVRLAAREDATGLLGSAWRRVEVPDLASGRLALSGLFLLKEGAAPAFTSPDAPLVLNSVQALPCFGRAESLYVQLYAYNPKRHASGAIDLVAQSEVLRGGVVLGTTAPQPMSEGRPGARSPHDADQAALRARGLRAARHGDRPSAGTMAAHRRVQVERPLLPSRGRRPAGAPAATSSGAELRGDPRAERLGVGPRRSKGPGLLPVDRVEATRWQ
jgi:hypothetical protein